MTREVILDCETTGISHEDGHRIISLGVVEMIHNKVTGRECEWFVNPERPCDRSAYEVHRIADRWLAQQPTFRIFAPDIVEFIGGDTIVAHNARFDRGHLNAEFARLLGLSVLSESDRNRFPEAQWIDSLKLARKLFPKQRNGLDDLADRFGVYRGHRVKHGALKDARILAEVWAEMRRGSRDDLFAGMPEQSMATRLPAIPYDYASQPPRRSRLTSAEEERWREVWLRGLGEKAVWNDYVLDKSQ